MYVQRFPAKWMFNSFKISLRREFLLVIHRCWNAGVRVKSGYDEAFKMDHSTWSFSDITMYIKFKCK